MREVWRLRDTPLDRKPGSEISHVVDPRLCGRDLLFQLIRTEITVLIEELREQCTKIVSSVNAAKQCCRRYSTTSFRTLEIRSIQCQVVGSGVRDRIPGVLRVRNVT